MQNSLCFRQLCYLRQFVREFSLMNSNMCNCSLLTVHLTAVYQMIWMVKNTTRRKEHSCRKYKWFPKNLFFMCNIFFQFEQYTYKEIWYYTWKWFIVLLDWPDIPLQTTQWTKICISISKQQVRKSLGNGTKNGKFLSALSSKARSAWFLA